MRVLMLSMHDNEQYFFEALKVGASGYVLKSGANRDLGLRRLPRGDAWASRSCICWWSRR